MTVDGFIQWTCAAMIFACAVVVFAFVVIEYRNLEELRRRG